MLKIEQYEDCVNELQKKNREVHLLLGNGFSIAYDHKIFSYNALQTFFTELKEPILDQLFAITRTKNLEVIMQQLRVISELLVAFGDSSGLGEKIENADEKLRSGLIDAVQSLHPEHVFTVDENCINSCYRFLDPFLREGRHIFTTNYDILLYWVLMRTECKTAIDGFGRELENPEETDPDEHIWSEELTWGPNTHRQNIHYLHGALHLFDTGIDIVKEEYDQSAYILEKIKQRMDEEEYPLFVTAGDGEDKLKQIVHSKYLSFCYDKLKVIQGSLIVFGFQFGQYDYHIIDAINEAAHYGKKSGNKLFSVYIGVFSDADADYVRSIVHKFKCKVRLFDSKSVGLWRA